MTDNPPDFNDTLRYIAEARERERNLPPLGSDARPYEIVVPGWVEDRLISEGSTSQQWYDENFLVAVKVTVVR